MKIFRWFLTSFPKDVWFVSYNADERQREVDQCRLSCIHSFTLNVLCSVHCLVSVTILLLFRLSELFYFLQTILKHCESDFLQIKYENNFTLEWQYEMRKKDKNISMGLKGLINMSWDQNQSRLIIIYIDLIALTHIKVAWMP